MVSCEPTQSYKVPLKACQNSVIEHNRVTIRLSVEWPEKGGDNPYLVIDITNKQPATPYMQQNQSSIPLNSVHHYHHHHPPQENVGSTFQQQYYHSSAINNHDPSSSTTAITIADHNDVASTTTTTVVYNSIQPQLQTSTTSTTNQQIRAEGKSQVPPILRCQSTLNQQYLAPQHIIQTSSTNMNDLRSNMPIPTFSPTPSMKTMTPLIPQFRDSKVASTMIHSSETKKSSVAPPVICSCLNPRHHENSCALFSPNNQQSNTNLSSEPMNRSNTKQATSTSHTRVNGAISIMSKQKPMTTTTYVPIPNPNLIKKIDPSSAVTTIISQPLTVLNTTQSDSTTKAPSSNTNMSFQQELFKFSQVVNNNQPNYQTNPPIPIPTVGQQNNSPNNSYERNSLTNQDQILFNNSQQVHFINNQNSRLQQQNSIPLNLLFAPIQAQQENSMFQNDSQTTDTTLSSTMNDININTAQQNSPPMKSVRSPVKLDIITPQNSNQSTSNQADTVIDETISDVIKGKGDILIHNSPKSAGPQRQSLLSKFVRESNEPTTPTKMFSPPSDQKQQLPAYDSIVSTINHQHDVDITQQVIRPNFTEQREVNTLSQQSATKNSKKRDRSKLTTKNELKRTYKSTTTTNIRQQTISLPSHQDILPPITSPITPTLNLINKPISWPDTPMSSSSSGSIVMASIGSSNQHLTNDSLQMPDINYDSTMLGYSVFNDERIQIIRPTHHHELVLDDMFLCKIDERSISSTPPPLFPSLPMSASMSNQLLNSVSVENSSSTLLTSDTYSELFYEDYLPPNVYLPSSIFEENQGSLSASAPPDFQNKHLPQQQYYSGTNTYDDSGQQSQTQTSQLIETISNFVNQMNNNDDSQTSSEQQQQQTKPSEKTNHQSNSIQKKSLKHPSKISKQQQRPNPIRKQSSTKPTCTRCGLTHLIDITHHEFPKQKGLVFECASCGNNSIRSNVSLDEHKRRLAKVAADHLHTVNCQFCHTIFHSHNEYLIHLKDDHASNKPM